MSSICRPHSIPTKYPHDIHIHEDFQQISSHWSNPFLCVMVPKKSSLILPPYPHDISNFPWISPWFGLGLSRHVPHMERASRANHWATPLPPLPLSQAALWGDPWHHPAIPGFLCSYGSYDVREPRKIGGFYGTEASRITKHRVMMLWDTIVILHAITPSQTSGGCSWKRKLHLEDLQPKCAAWHQEFSVQISQTIETSQASQIQAEITNH